MHELLSIEKAEIGLCFHMADNAAERHGAIGCLSADFGKSGKEFLTAWYDNQRHLNTSSFKMELDSIIDALRSGNGIKPFANRDSLSEFIATEPVPGSTYKDGVFMVRTQAYSYYFRCKPQIRGNDILCFAYDNRYLLPELAGKHELPDKCFSTLPSTGELISITRHEKGYSLCCCPNRNTEETRFFAGTSNKIHGVTRAQEEAMLAGALFGWDIPASKPWKYDMDGKPRQQHPPKKNEPER